MDKSCERCGTEIHSVHYNTKYCPTCKIKTDRESWMRYHNTHKDVRATYREKNKTRISNNNKKYRKEHLENIKEKGKIRYEANKKSILEKQYKRLKENPPKPKIELKCRYCGKTFLALRRKKKFCSLDCNIRSQRTNSVKVCAWCGKEFYVSVSQELQRNRKCCSRSCGAKYNAKFRSGENSNFWRGGVSSENRKQRYSANASDWRRQIFKRDNYTCQHCFKRGSYLHAHHIKPWAKFPELRFDVNNGITLCRICHKKEHDRIGWK